MIAIGDSLSTIARSHNGEDREDENDEETEQGKLSEDDEPRWVLGTISKTIQHRMERLRQKQMKVDELTLPRWGDAADYIHDRAQKCGTFDLRVPDVAKLQMHRDVAAPALQTFGEYMKCLDIVSRR